MRKLKVRLSEYLERAARGEHLIAADAGTRLGLRPGHDRRGPSRGLTLYLDSSALLKRYLEEWDSTRYNSILGSDEAWLTCQITWVEVWRNLGRRLTAAGAPTARDAFQADWTRLAVVEIDAVLTEEASRLADLIGARSLDALHLSAVQHTGPIGARRRRPGPSGLGA